MFAARRTPPIACVILLSAVWPLGCRQKSEVAEAQPVERLNFIKLTAEHDAQREKYVREFQAASANTEAATNLSREFREYLLSVIDKVLKIAEAEPSTITGLDAAQWVLGHCDGGYAPHVRAAELLLAHQPHPESLPAELYRHLDGYEPVYERLLRLGAESNPSRESKAQATFELANLLCARADFADAMDASPELDHERIKNFGAEVVQYLKSTDPDQTRAEAKELYEHVEREYADVAYQNRTLGEVAHEHLLPFTQGYPEIGKLAPDIDATDLNGDRLTLQSLRGKVVVVSFWASWCGPCLARVPEENELVEEFADADFAFLGVNGDAAIEDARRAVDEHSIRFPSCWDDPEADETIVARWGVTGWPTTFVLDQTGTIRFKNLSGPDLRRALGQLLESDEASTEEKSPPRSLRPPR